MDRIIFNQMQFYGYHGVFPEENKLGQRFNVDLELFFSLKQAGVSDRLEDTINYAEVYQQVKEIMEQERYQLVEAVAERVATVLLQRFTPLEQVLVRVIKPDPPIPGHYHSIAVEIRRVREDV